MEHSLSTPTSLAQKVVVVIVGFSLLCLAAVVAQYQAAQQARQHLFAESQKLEASIENELNRFRNLPKILAFQEQFIEVLQNPGQAGRLLQVNRFLEQINLLQGSDVTYLLDAQGLTLASSNWQSTTSFVGSSYSYRPYFQSAITGSYGQYFALGSRSGVRGYYFSAPVRFKQQVIGVLVIKVALNIIEQSWRDPNIEYVLTDKHGVIFYSSQSHWLYNSIRPLEDSLRQQIINSRQYGDNQLVNIAVQQDEQSMSLPDFSGQVSSYSSISRNLPTAGWRLYALSPQRGYFRDIGEAVFLTSLFYLALLLLWFYWRQMQARRALLAKLNQELEKRVQLRTAELTESNRQLQQAVYKYQQTANTLKQTENELVQAAKLATLGELSAGINHELNQPLTAIQSYAENAQRFIEKERYQQVQSNLSQITQLSAMMGKMIAKFKVFARKSQGQTSRVSSRQAINAALSILANRIVGSGIKVELAGEQELWVEADAVQLEQVLINLMNNAIDALENQEQATLGIRLLSEPSGLQIQIWDNGPELSQEQLERLFEPFFTTKKQGLGLGMAISKRLIESFGGELSVRNIEGVGPEFTIRLRAALPLAAQAELGEQFNDQA